ncbi:nondiscriminating glutamyl-tRNA synthetase EARS2, mitochondrial isoform X2 [Parasteatoda tepidariorum]|uniref:nondiscriminating glutamyl-tRNA synthetase EARS2, mitochondrial isoform X2 n=1 Tax=Parasteatoda tepidariorum TaxID=114398 RepID=UPI001C7296B0|nr:probable glutamate--tRNA ligase, mitochondrial isoform X2 [Parasteatoda tepidariorum]
MVSIRYLLYAYRHYSSLSSNVRVRFAPSPTGCLHLGGLRTAFFNYLFAKKMKGKFILRIEDTDQKRIKPGSVENLNEMLKWTGLIPDESPSKGGSYGPYVQSERLRIYKEKIEDLLKSNAAYRCFCSETRLNIMKKDALQRNESRGYDNKCRHLKESEIQTLLNEGIPYTIRFKIPEEPVSHNDIIFGTHTHSVSENEGDFVILKSDGFPTYHFACVVDDHLMYVSHVLRGTEWLISTPKHIMLYNAFGWTPPKYAHLPLLTNSDRTKLSKRQEAIGIDYFKFNLDQVNKNSCIVDFRKLDLLNNNYITRKLSNDEGFVELVRDFRRILKTKFGQRYEEERNKLTDSYLKKVLLCYKDRMTTLLEMTEKDMEYLWISPKYENVMQLLSNLRIPDSVIRSLKDVQYQLSLISSSDYNEEKLSSKLKEISSELKIKYSILMRTIRVVTTGQKDGPGVSEVLTMLGKEGCLEKLSAFIKEIELRESKIFLE